MKTQQQLDDIHQCEHCNGEFLTEEALEDHIEECPDKESEDNGSEPVKEEETSVDTGKVKKLPVNRDYNWNNRIPSDIPEYKESDQELTRILADIKNRSESGQLARYLISGDTGAGKTHLAETVAENRNSPLFTIQGKYSMDESDLLGSPVLVNGETIWTDGTLTKALLASQEREVVLLVDELNRARPESKGVLFSALDDRCKVELDARGGEVVQGNPENLIVIGTINEGSDFAVQQLDRAEKRRFGRKFEVQHLGINHPEKEAQVVSDRTPASEPVAERLVEVSNEIREDSDNQASVVDSGIPTSSILDWARTAYAYSNSGVSNPIVESAKDTVVRPIFDRDRVREEVTQTVRDYVDSAPFEEKKFEEWRDNPEEFNDSVCSNCGRTFESKRGVSLHQSQSDCGE